MFSSVSGIIVDCGGFASVSALAWFSQSVHIVIHTGSGGFPNEPENTTMRYGNVTGTLVSEQKNTTEKSLGKINDYSVVNIYKQSYVLRNIRCVRLP